MIKDNPFYILNIPMDASKAVMAAASEAALLRSDKGAADDALSKLLNPERRLQAELDWLPGVPVETINTIRTSIRKSLPAGTDGLSGIALLNAGLYNFALGDKFMYRGDRIRIYHTGILNIAKAFDRINREALLADINKARENAGVSPVTLSQLNKALEDKKERICREIDELILRMPAGEYRQLFSRLTDSLKKEGASLLGPVMNDLFDRYEVNTYAVAEKLADKVRKLSEKIVKDSFDAPMLVRFDAYRINDAVLNWERVIRPLEVKAVVQGWMYGPARELADKLYDEMLIDLAFRNANAAAELAENLIYAFRETPKLADIFRVAVAKKKELDRESRERKASNFAFDVLILMLLVIIIAALIAFFDWVGLLDDSSPSQPQSQPTYNEPIEPIDPAELDKQLEEARRELEELEENGSIPAVPNEENAEN